MYFICNWWDPLHFFLLIIKISIIFFVTDALILNFGLINVKGNEISINNINICNWQDPLNSKYKIKFIKTESFLFFTPSPTWNITFLCHWTYLFLITNFYIIVSNYTILNSNVKSVLKTVTFGYCLFHVYEKNLVDLLPTK